jgi:hypothetical protein
MQAPRRHASTWPFMRLTKLDMCAGEGQGWLLHNGQNHLYLTYTHWSSKQFAPVDVVVQAKAVSVEAVL